jgi:hypothetical protein
VGACTVAAPRHKARAPRRTRRRRRGAEASELGRVDRSRSALRIRALAPARAPPRISSVIHSTRRRVRGETRSLLRLDVTRSA